MSIGRWLVERDREFEGWPVGIYHPSLSPEVYSATRRQATEMAKRALSEMQLQEIRELGT